jgi:hypothetical protein
MLIFYSVSIWAEQNLCSCTELWRVWVACLGCRVDNPLNAVGGNEDDYSTMVLGTALLGGIQQTLIFPDLRADTRLVVGIGTDNIPLSVQLLSG